MREPRNVDIISPLLKFETPYNTTDIIVCQEFFVKKFTGIAGFLGSGRKNGFLGGSPAIMLRDRTLGVVGWFHIFLLSESGFSGFKDFQD